MPQHTTNLYTVWKEPGHKLICANAGAKDCRTQLGMEEGHFYHFIKCVRAGKRKDYSLSVEKISTKDFNRLIEDEQKPVYYKHNQRFANHVPMESGAILCGDCAYWMKEKRREADLHLYGRCSFKEDKTERCDWCFLDSRGKGGEADD